MSVERSELNVGRSGAAGRAVFLSYASQDADAAKRICDALRAAGVEAWFDQSELRGGDSWDAMIRKRIKECALFVPVISANTNARAEGYFRLEWKLAVDRSHLMADDAAFLFPVVIGDVTDATARVPDKFREVQWTRLRLEETPVELAARVAKLLAGGVAGVGGPGPGSARRATGSRKDTRWWMIFPVLGSIMGLMFATGPLWRLMQGPRPKPNAPPIVAAPAAPEWPVNQDLKRAMAIVTGWEGTAESYALADDLVKGVLVKAPTDTEATIVYATVNNSFLNRGFDLSAERYALARRYAERALQLAPDHPEALAAMAQSLTFRDADYPRAETLIRRAIDLAPQESRYRRILTFNILFPTDPAEALRVTRENVRQFPNDPLVAYNMALICRSTGDLELMEEALDKCLALAPVGSAMIWKGWLAAWQHGDLPGFKAWLDRISGDFRVNDRVVYMTYVYACLSGDLASGYKALNGGAGTWMRDYYYIGPRSLLLGDLYARDGKPDLAREQYEQALAEITRQQAANPGDYSTRAAQIWTLLGLGRLEEARKLNQLGVDALSRPFRPVYMIWWHSPLPAQLLLGERANALALIREAAVAPAVRAQMRVALRIDPRMAPFRDDPEIAALLAATENGERRTEDGGQASHGAGRATGPGLAADSIGKTADGKTPATAPFPSPLLPSPSRPPAADAKSVAVLPFANLSADPDNAFFADGVHDDVITNLAKIRDLKVISRTSVLAYRDPAARNLKTIAVELGVVNILEGSVRRAGNRVRVTAQLIDARTDVHLWADSFDGDLTDIFALQARLAQQIAGALQATLTGSERALIERRPTQNQEAYDLFLRARAMQQEQGETGSITDFERIVTVYDEAIARDPAFALAYAQVAQVHSILNWFGYLDPSPARAEKVKAAAAAAARLAPDAPETHVALGGYHYRVNLDWNRALAEFRLAEAGLPNDPQLQFWLAVTHRRLGHWAEAAGHFAHSVALNPRDLASVSNATLYMSVLRRWEPARTANDKALTYFPTDRELLQNRARVAFALDGDATAYAWATEKLPPSDFDPAGTTGKFQAALLRRDFDAARQALDGLGSGKMLEWYGNVISDPVTFHQAYVAFLRGDRDGARRLAEQAIAHYRGERWNTRQQPWVQMRIAQLEAWAGRADEALRDGREALSVMLAQDAMGGVQLLEKFGTVLVSLDRRDEALARLREIMAGPCTMSPNEFRVDPLWSRLKDDPRFEEILKTAKAL